MRRAQHQNRATGLVTREAQVVLAYAASDAWMKKVGQGADRFRYTYAFAKSVSRSTVSNKMPLANQQHHEQVPKSCVVDRPVSRIEGIAP